MKFSLLFSTLFISLTSGLPASVDSSWKAPGPNDFRGPCPMMNTLANHGFLPRNGRNLTRDKVVSALNSALNFNESLANIMFDQAVPANPKPNATFFTLDQLNRHNVLEHDASMSREDAYFGNNHIFNKRIFDQTRQYWTGPVLDRYMLTNGKIARQLQSRKVNPTYRFTSVTEAFSIGEVLAPVIVFGDRDTVTVNKTLVDFFFENERLPSQLGWTKQERVVNLEDIARLSQIFSDAATLLTGSDTAATKRGLHSAMDL